MITKIYRCHVCGKYIILPMAKFTPLPTCIICAKKLKLDRQRVKRKKAKEQSNEKAKNKKVQ